MNNKYNINDKVAFRDGRRTMKGIITRIESYPTYFHYIIEVGIDKKQYTVWEEKIVVAG